MQTGPAGGREFLPLSSPVPGPGPRRSDQQKREQEENVCLAYTREPSVMSGPEGRLELGTLEHPKERRTHLWRSDKTAEKDSEFAGQQIAALRGGSWRLRPVGQV